MADGPLFHKPKSFLTARQVLYTCLFLGLLQFLISVLNAGLANSGGTMAVVSIVIFIVLALWLIKEMSRCRKWARTALTAFLLLGMIVYPMVVFQVLKTSLLQAALLIIQFALEIYAVVLLYKTECTEWFNSITRNEMLP